MHNFVNLFIHSYFFSPLPISLILTTMALGNIMYNLFSTFSCFWSLVPFLFLTLHSLFVCKQSLKCLNLQLLYWCYITKAMVVRYRYELQVITFMKLVFSIEVLQIRYKFPIFSFPMRLKHSLCTFSKYFYLMTGNITGQYRAAIGIYYC